VLAVVALAFLTLDLGGSGLRGAHTGMRGVLGSLYRGTDAVLGPVRRFVEGIPTAGTNTSRIDELRSENAKLRAQLALQATDKRTAAALHRLKLSANSTGATILPARVIALGPGEGFDWTVTLDAGTSSGVRVGQTVTDGLGLVGRVLHADADTSVVLLAADPGSGVGVRDLRSGQIGVAKGEGTDGFSFTPLSPDAVIKVGDRVETGPLNSSSFVAGIAVGTVASVRTSADGTVTATIKPTVSPTALDVVGVIVHPASTGTTRLPLTPISPPTNSVTSQTAAATTQASGQAKPR
jgi:rod shape-determining protein MreC